MESRIDIALFSDRFCIHGVIGTDQHEAWELLLDEFARLKAIDEQDEE